MQKYYASMALKHTWEVEQTKDCTQEKAQQLRCAFF